MLLALAALFWSGNHIIGRAIVGYVPPYTISMLRWLLPCIFLLPFAWPHLKRDWPVIVKHWKIILFLGVTGGAIFTAGQYVGLQYTTALNVSVLNSISPVAIVAASAVLFGDRLKPVQAAGILVSLLGVLVIISKADFATLLGIDFNYGDIVIFFNMLVIAVFSSVLRKMPKVHWLSSIFTFSVISTVCLLPFSALEMTSGANFEISVPTILAIIYVAIFPSVLAYVFWTRGIEAIGANRAGPFLHLIPVYSAVMASAFLGERLMIYHLAGFILILAGVWAASVRMKRPAASA